MKGSPYRSPKDELSLQFVGRSDKPGLDDGLRSEPLKCITMWNAPLLSPKVGIDSEYEAAASSQLLLRHSLDLDEIEQVQHFPH